MQRFAADGVLDVLYYERGEAWAGNVLPYPTFIGKSIAFGRIFASLRALFHKKIGYLQHTKTKFLNYICLYYFLKV